MFTEKGKGFKRKELHCLDDRGKVNLKDVVTCNRDVRGPGSLGRVQERRRGREPSGILWRRVECGKEKCPTGDVYIF